MAYNPSRSLKTVEAGIKRLIAQFQSKPRLTAELTSFLQRVQELEDVLWQIILGRSIIAFTSPRGVAIKVAVGAQLDQLGKIVGVTRGGLGDSDFLIAIAAQIFVNRSSGSTSDYLYLLKISSPSGLSYTGPGAASPPWTVTDLYPATELVQILVAATWNVLVTWRYLQAVKAGGARLLFVWSPAEPSTQFQPYDVTQLLSGDRTWGYDSSTGGATPGVYASGFAV